MTIISIRLVKTRSRALVNDNDQRDRYRSAFVQDGYIYIFSDRQIRSYSYDDLSKPTDSVDIVK